MRDETSVIHAGYSGDSTRAVAVPIYQTVAHDFIDADHAAGVFDLEIPGFHYNRINNPTNAVLEERLNQLHGGVGALTLSSGTAAVSQSVLNLVSQGNNLVSVPQLYGATYTLFAHLLPRYGVEVRFPESDSAAAIEPLLDDRTAGIFCESIGNPAGNIVDLEALANLAHAHGVPLVVDNTVATPLLLKPFAHGADVVVESLTKWVGGHGTTLGGAIVDGGSFPWSEHPDRFPLFNQPEPCFHGVVYSEHFGKSAYIVRCRTVGMRNFGPTLSPFSAFQLLQGLETLPVRLERHERNARQVAAFLAQDPRVAWVSYSDFPDHPHHQLQKRYLGDHTVSMMTFGVVGGYDAGLVFFNSVRLFKRLVNLGDAKSLVSHPASTTHRQLTPEEHARAGVRPEAIRLSVGLEHIDDILEDLDQALAASQGLAAREA
ncbi:MAG: O-acetylhomoserine aminocarboxypropyltransferase/cysteine synthase [Candidatus Dormibacteraeota bacterium]|jgi:O-acetylhomoserine (thiol)-lyase|nr:O-acetylhomoserine aminocarboxypropyltransferase/cysteine synthase [Candidatus Dormibacteraeota bacterium]